MRVGYAICMGCSLCGRNGQRECRWDIRSQYRGTGASDGSSSILLVLDMCVEHVDRG